VSKLDWNKIKTIFILTFLVLDIYLMYEFMKVRAQNQYELITETSIEDKLAADKIKYPELPKGPIKDQYVSAKPKTFNGEEAMSLIGQTISIVDGTTIHGTFDKPLQLGDKFDPAEINSFIKTNILYGDHYAFWEYSEKEKKITYYQKYQDKFIYSNKNGSLEFFLNDSHQIISYRQTFLEDIGEMAEKEEVLSPLKALETLYQKGMLEPGSKIKKVELGYYTYEIFTTSQVLTPAWRFVVNDDENLFVNAFEGQIIELNSEEKK
jgi:regulatory protein YycI of two-component signal transduction system YycFG